jgi:hypothetical protein
MATDTLSGTELETRAMEENTSGFDPLPKRWIIERTFG